MIALRLALPVILIFLAGSVGAEEQELQARAKEPSGDARYQLEKTSLEVRRAIRLLLSSDRHEERRGRKQLLLLGPAVAPQLRYWIRGVREDSAKVEHVLALIEKDGGRSARLSYHLEEFLGDKFREAKAMKDRGEYQQARKLAEAMLTLDPGQPGAWELRRFVRECVERIAAKELLEPAFTVAQWVFEVGEDPELVFRIRNHNDQRAVIHLEKGVLGSAKVTMTRYHASGLVRRTEQQIIVRAAAPDERIIIGPGRMWEQRVPLNLGEPLPLSGVVARLQLAGRFRPTRWTTEDKNENLSLSLPRTEFWVVPPGQTSLADRPLEKLTTALVFDREAAFFVGGQLAVGVGEQDPVYNGKVVDTLVSHLEKLTGPRLAIALRLLEQATGMGFGPEPEKWKSWWGSWRVADSSSEPGASQSEPRAK